MDVGAWIAFAALAIAQLGTVTGMVRKSATTRAQIAATLAAHALDLKRGDQKFDRLERRLDALVQSMNDQNVALGRIAERIEAIFRADNAHHRNNERG